MAGNPFSSEEMMRVVTYRRLKQSVAQHLPQNAYGALTNLQVVLRNESAYGEMLGVAVKTQIAAGDTYDCPQEYHYVPATWWDHLKVTLFPGAAEEARNLARDFDTDWDVPWSIKKRRQFYLWLSPRLKELPMYVERIHVCPHADVDFRKNPEPHVRHLLEKKQ